MLGDQRPGAKLALRVVRCGCAAWVAGWVAIYEALCLCSWVSDEWVSVHERGGMWSAYGLLVEGQTKRFPQHTPKGVNLLFYFTFEGQKVYLLSSAIVC